MTQQLINVVISVSGGAATYALLKWITVRHGAKTRKAQTPVKLPESLARNSRRRVPARSSLSDPAPKPAG